MFPKEISDNQKIKLYEFADEINDYFIDIAYDFTVDDGFLNASELKSSSTGDISNLLDTYFEKKHNKIKQKVNLCKMGLLLFFIEL